MFSNDSVAGSRIETALDRYGPEVRRMLGVTTANPPDVYFMSESGLENGITAACFSTHIVLDSLGQSDLEYSIAHELAHWHITSSIYANLPLFGQEGLAVFVGLTFFPPFLDNAGNANTWNTHPPQPSHLYLDREGWYQLNVSERRTLSMLSLEVIYRIGLDKLRVLCESGRTSIPDLLEEAGIYIPSSKS